MDVNRLYQQSRGESWWVRLLLPVLALVWLGELATPISQLVQSSSATWSIGLALTGTTAFVAVYAWVVAGAVRVRSGLLSPPASPLLTCLPPLLMAILAVPITPAYGPAWLGLFIFAAVGSALRLPTRYAAWAIATLTVGAGCIGLLEGDSLTDLAQGGLLIAGIGASVTTVGYTIRLTRELRAARVEVARLAVGEERLRFARDLHDLLGRSLSLVALKCDLADQLITSAPQRARHEIQQAASITRDALREVRETVARVMRSMPELEKFQVIVFAEETRYLLAGPGRDGWFDYDAKADPGRVLEALAKIKPEGGTNMYAALEAAFRLRPAGLDTIYLLSDGLPNVGAGLTAEEGRRLSEAERNDRLGKHVRKTLRLDWNRARPGQPRVRINSIGFFYESPKVGAFLWALSRENAGSFVGMSRP